MSTPIGALAALSAAAMWAIGSTLFSRIGRDVSPFTMNLGKCLSAGGLLGLTYCVLNGPHVSAGSAALAWLAASAIVGLTIGDTAYFHAIVRLGVPRAILLLSSAPVFAAIGAAVFMNEPLGARSASGIGVTLAGIAITVSASGGPKPSRSEPALASDEASPSKGVRVVPGMLFGLVAGLGQAAGSLLSKHAMREGLDPLFVSAGRLLIGGGALVLVSTLTGRATMVVRELTTRRAWLRIAGAGFIGSYCGIWLAQTALACLPSAGVATTLLATSPVFALPIAHFTGAERVGLRGVIGAAITIAGVALLAT